MTKTKPKNRKKAGRIKVMAYLDNCVISDIASQQGIKPERPLVAMWRLLLGSRLYQPVVSDLVVVESENGKNPSYVARRRKLIAKVHVLAVPHDAAPLALRLRKALKWSEEKMINDALHIAVAHLSGVGVVLTDDGIMVRAAPQIELFLRTTTGRPSPTICTPATFIGIAANPLRPSRGVREARAYRKRIGKLCGGNPWKMLKLMGIKTV